MIGGLHEAFRLAGGLAFIMFAMMSCIAVAVVGLVRTIRREQRLAEVEAATEHEGVDV
jgi:hypothetical protein